MNELINEDIKIEDRIFEIRGKQVMLDSDLAKLYKCKNGTKSINLAVKRNMERFPQDFYFQINIEEFENLKFHFETSNSNNNGGIRKLPYAFTEQGVAMLATIIKTPIASNVSINIMRAFVKMRKYISNNLFEQKYINNIVLEDHERINLLQESFSKFEEKRKVNEIYFNGQIYDAYSKILDIFKEATKSLIIIDAYVDKSVLDIISKLNVKVTLICKSNSLFTKMDIEKYNKQYSNLKIIYNDTFHDRYFILDNSIVYHCGTSLNRIGYKTFSITLINDEEISCLIIDKVNKI